jgi:hypothetical protein
MSEPVTDGTEPAAPPGRTAETDWERRRRLAEVFGEVLPETTADERELGSPAREESQGDAWLRAQVPPHHG